MKKLVFQQLSNQLLAITCSLFIFNACGTYLINPTNSVADEFISFGDPYQIVTKGGLAWNLEFSFGEFTTNTINLLHKTDFKFVIRNASGDSIQVWCKEIPEMAESQSLQYQNQVSGLAEVPVAQIEDIQEINTERQIKQEYKPNIDYAFYIELKTKSGKKTVRYLHSEPSELRMESNKISLIPYYVYKPLENVKFMGVLFENEDNTKLLGGVEINANRVWIDSNLNKDERLILAALSIALINIPRH